MKLFAPAYYPAFRCIAGDCRHSCCIGWEIRIDPESLARYKALPPKERKAILSPTITQKGRTFFRLAPDGRCPHLTKDRLCKLILAHGEEILCHICREHPRFYNHFSQRTEAGLGLCCEEAARLILTDPEPFRLICLEEDEGEIGVPDPFEAIFFHRREEIFRILCDRTAPLPLRIERLLESYSLSRTDIYESDGRWQQIYRNLERLDSAWDDALSAWQAVSPPAALPDSPTAEQLIAYFLYRHLAGARDDGRYAERVGFALLSAHVIGQIASAVVPDDLSTLIDVARAYSAEVEYDEDNVAAILQAIPKGENVPD